MYYEDLESLCTQSSAQSLIPCPVAFREWLQSVFDYRHQIPQVVLVGSLVLRRKTGLSPGLAYTSDWSVPVNVEDVCLAVSFDDPPSPSSRLGTACIGCQVAYSPRD
jgi:hypothetical protein